MTKHARSAGAFIAVLLTLTFFTAPVGAFSGVQGRALENAVDPWVHGGQVLVTNNTTGQLVSSGDLVTGDPANNGLFNFPYTQTTHGGNGVAPLQGHLMTITIHYNAGACGVPPSTQIDYTELTFIPGRFSAGNRIVECPTYTVGGTVSGLVGSGLVLRNNGGDDLPVVADGAFTFESALSNLSAYDVTVLTQPGGPSQTCSVSNAGGNLAGANVTDVAVNCVTERFSVGGTVSGLVGSGLVLQNNGGDDLMPSVDGGFAFAGQEDGTGYSVTVATQPGNPGQSCAVANGLGTVSGANVTDVQVSCVTDTYSVTAVTIGGGTITPPAQTVEDGAAASFSVAPDAGWSLASITGDTCTPEDQGEGLWIAANINQDCVVLASFTAIATDLQIAKDSGVDSALDGQVLVYAITVTNAGPAAVSGAQLLDVLPASLIDAEWACLPAESNTACPPAPFDAGSGDLYAEIDLPVDGFLRYDLSARVQADGGTLVSNTATVTPPAGIDELEPSNNSATDAILIAPEGIFASGFEAGPAALTVPAAARAQREAAGR